MPLNVEDIKRIRIKSAENNQRKQSSLKGYLNREISFFKKNVSKKKKEHFFSQLDMLLSSGIDLKDSFKIFLEEIEKDKQYEIFKKIEENLVLGLSLFQAMEKSGKFSQYDCYNVKIAEETGRLPLILNRLAMYYQRHLKMNRQVINSMIYPMLVLITAFFAVFFMVKFIIPLFSGIYERANLELPQITQLVINMSDYFGRIMLMTIALLMIFLLLHLKIRNHHKYREFTSLIFRKIPFFGQLVNIIYQEQFFNSLGILSHSKINLLDAISIVSKMIRYYPLERILADIHKDIMNGLLFYETLKKQDFFENRVVSLVKVGEEANKLEEVFDKISHQYSLNVESKLTMLQNILEPVLILFIGSIVGFILISMYLPLFQISNTLY